MKPAIIYTRFSPRPDASTSHSCERQEERCRAYCKSKDYDIYGVFNDKNVSGKTIDRPQLDDAIALLESGMVVVVDTGDRLARDMLVELTIRAKIESTGCTIEYADGSPTSNTPEGELVRNIFAAFAHYERSKTSRRTKAGLARKRANGQHLGRAPIGWKYDKRTKKLVENREEQKSVDLIRKYFRIWKTIPTAESVESICGNFRGKHWSQSTIRKIIQSAQ
jgi:site-specific DNA recombinase